MKKHMDRRYYSLYFNSCEDETCPLPQCGKRESKKAKEWNAWFHGDAHGKMFTVTPNPDKPGHYYTFLEMDELMKLGKWNQDTTDVHVPSLQESFTDDSSPTYPGNCSKLPYGCNYTFVSNKDR